MQAIGVDLQVELGLCYFSVLKASQIWLNLSISFPEFCVFKPETCAKAHTHFFKELWTARNKDRTFFQKKKERRNAVENSQKYFPCSFTFLGMDSDPSTGAQLLRGLWRLPAVTIRDHPLLCACKNYLVASQKLISLVLSARSVRACKSG